MSHQTEFSLNVEAFLQNGTYNYQFDEAGNVVLNPSSSVFSEVYLSIPLKNYLYDELKVLSFYDPTFTEFPAIEVSSPATSSVEAQKIIDEIKAENEQLTSQLNQLISQSEVTTPDVDQQVIKDIVIDLRRALGEGSIETDFEPTFPYLPKALDKREIK